MTKIRRGSSLTTFVWWNQPKLKRGEKVKVSKSTVELQAARVKRIPKVGDNVVVTWYFTQGPCRKITGTLLRVYAIKVFHQSVNVAEVDSNGSVLRVDLERVSKGKS